MFPIIEKFLSIDGEGPTAGQLAAFVRFQGCNLRCTWCDTVYSYDESSVTEHCTAEEILEFIKQSGARCVTLTGGEPLLQPQIGELLSLLDKEETLLTHIETNGSVDITPFRKKFQNISFIVDYKLPKSGMTDRMERKNLSAVTMRDAYKFVIGGQDDLEAALKILQESSLCERTQVFFSPVFGLIEPAEIVEFMKENALNRVRLQLQLHKLIWNPEERGV